MSGIRNESFIIPADSTLRADNSSIRISKTLQVCVVGESLKQNDDFMKSLKCFNFPIVYSRSGLELMSREANFTTIYILDAFEGEVFVALHRAGQRILGPTAVMKCAKSGQSLPNSIRPLYTLSMNKLSISFAGFRSKEELSKLANLIHHMGGSIRREFSVTKTSHLVATVFARSGDKYKYAVGMNIPVMSSEWVYKAWAKRNDFDCLATDEELMKYKLLPFVGCKLAFVGSTPDEKEHMIEVSIQNGAEIVELEDVSCTHVIVEDGHKIKNSDYPNSYLVTNEWFWASLQMEAKADESLYVFEKNFSTVTSSTHIRATRGNKRKRLESVAHQLAVEGMKENEFFNLSHSFEMLDGPKLSISGSFLDATFSPEKSADVDTGRFSTASLDKIKSPLPDLRPTLDIKAFSARQQVCFEMFQTESNYVGILHTIITVFKEPLEQPDQIGGLLNSAEVKLIFGNIPPIYKTHLDIRQELTGFIHSWREDHSIGSIFLNYANEFMKSYPPFVNYFEKTKEVLAACDASKPRFHAFLKRCQSKPECGRQTLQELLIRPVQRLPSVILLLSDIMKHTPKSNPDHQALEKAIQAVKNVLMHINEDKRKTEGQMEMFDIINDVENCPPVILSSQRTLISKTDMFEATDLLCKQGTQITMFLFNDLLEICKKRNKSLNATMKSPGVSSLAMNTLKAQSKPYKHLEMMYLTHIKRIADVSDTESHKNIFAIVSWSSSEVKEQIHAFILGEDTCKSEFLKALVRQVGIAQCKTETTLLTSLEPHQLDLQAAASSGNAFSKAMKRTQSKLGRALSLKRTPSKRLLRTVSSMFSPMSRSSNSISTLKLSSATNLTELLPPLTPSPVLGKKRKSGSFSFNSSTFSFR